MGLITSTGHGLVEVFSYERSRFSHFRELTKRARHMAAPSGVTMETIVQQGHEVERIVSAAKEGRFDLLVIGRHEHSRIFERTMGSTAQSIVRHAPCPVLVAK